MAHHSCLELPEILCQLGRGLAGAEECLAVEEAISPLDKVRLAAFTGDIDPICRPPLLGTDSMIPGELFLYNEGCSSRILKGQHNVHQIRGLHVVGGAMMHTMTCVFPVSILYSDIKGGLVLHAGSVPIAKLESEFYDLAFSGSDSWAKYVMGSEAIEFAQWRREAAAGVRCAGLGGTPRYLIGEDSYRVIRHGVTAFMSLRCPNNDAEHAAVKQRLVDDLAVLPKGSRDLMKTYSQHKCIVMCFLGSSDARLPRKEEIVEPPLDERLRSADTLLDDNPVLTWISSIILHCACDDAFDQQGEPIGEYYSGLKYKSKNEGVISDVSSREKAFLVRARNTKCTDIETNGLANPGPFTLTEVMKDTNRSHATKAVCDLTGTQSKVVMETVASAIFDADDAKLVADICASNCTSSMTPVTAVSVLGKCLVDHQALVIVTRDTDGRISNAKLVGYQTVVPKLNKDALARMMLFPWATVLFVDKERVSMLLVKDPEFVDGKLFEREPLKLRESAKPRSSSGDCTLQKTVDELKQEVASLKAENTAAITAIKDFEKKLNFLVEKKATDQEDESRPQFQQALPPPPEVAAPSAPSPPSATEDSEVIKSLKRTLATLTTFASKRKCP